MRNAYTHSRFKRNASYVYVLHFNITSIESHVMVIAFAVKKKGIRAHEDEGCALDTVYAMSRLRYR